MAHKSRYTAKNKYTKKSSNAGDWIKIVGAAGVILAALGIGGYYLYNQPKGPDRVTLCPAEGPLGHVVVLVDNTDPYSFIQREAFSQALRALSDEVVPEGYLLSVFSLGESFENNAKPLFERCNPGTSAGKSEMTANLKRIDLRYHESFKAPIEKLEDSLLSDTPAQYSPIFEMIQLASINGFRTQNVRGPRKLIIFSDMLPNTPEYSMFKGIPDYNDFSKTPYGERSKTDLSGVKVEIHYLMKYPKLQTMKQLNFWELYFEGAGARLTGVNTMEG
ncbi:hypothetical protein thsps21_18220 [Pseudomonas sp. No.21]|uniref:hypothetical protein n=1 Tax=Pseudomonas sp. TUM22785 TaxID=3019098 RepID=UPI0023062945|nr:hypothetical protein [Pseudomonas sp. TUM22785]WCD78557.1 hypothetical protein PI990_21460 [Pseudomonas sp. TUM22785]